MKNNFSRPGLSIKVACFLILGLFCLHAQEGKAQIFVPDSPQPEYVNPAAMVSSGYVTRVVSMSSENQPMAPLHIERYDKKGRLISITDKEGVRHFEYDAAGRLTGIVDSLGIYKERRTRKEISYSYDDKGRLTGKSEAGRSMKLQYEGNVAKGEINGSGAGSCTATYDNEGRLLEYTALDPQGKPMESIKILRNNYGDARALIERECAPDGRIDSTKIFNTINGKGVLLQQLITKTQTDGATGETSVVVRRKVIYTLNGKNQVEKIVAEDVGGSNADTKFFTYNAAGLPTRLDMVDSAGKLVARYQYQYLDK